MVPTKDMAHMKGMVTERDGMRISNKSTELTSRSKAAVGEPKLEAIEKKEMEHLCIAKLAFGGV